ncbi:MAG: hypothetical protein IKU40_01465 [Clostridia bacterium]|nr:hypothetical protein [Clostridia bacterium]
MAKNKKNKKDNAGDSLFGRLGRSSGKNAAKSEEELLGLDAEQEVSGEYDSIDLSEDADSSDSELDISELLRKYMPEYLEDEKPAGGSGVLSRLKQTMADTEEESDDKLISALDSVFSQAVEETMPAAEAEEWAEPQNIVEELLEVPEELAAEESDEVPEEPVSRPKKGGLFGRKKREVPEQQDEEFEFREADEDGSGEELSEEELIEVEMLESAAEWLEEEPAEKPKKKKFGFGFGRKKKRAEIPADDELPEETEAVSEEETADEPAEELTFEEGTAVEFEEEFSVEPMPEAAEDKPAEEAPETPAEEAEAGEYPELGETIFDVDIDEEPEGLPKEIPMLRLKLIEEPEEKAAEEAEAPAETAEEEPDEPIDSTDMNLMIAFGMDGKGDKKADKAKEFGDRLEAKQHSHDAKKVQLDRPEFVDKTQTPKIRREFKFRSVSLGVKLCLCAVFTVLLMVFENIAVLTKLFTGTSMQFGGAFDPAVYPTVYIMVSLQLMLLACLCAYEQIANGFKYLFRGIPRPESMLSVLTLLGVLYSVILVRVNRGEPVMFNFVVALTAFYTLIYALYNHKREVLNFRIVANKRPKHIVRRLADEESEGEARAFEDNDEVCDVMKIEKTDFIEGFFGRLSKPDPATTRFMAALLSTIGAIAVLFGILMNFRGGDADAVLGAFFASLLIAAPLSIYITFSYPFYRANLAAKEYDSAIVGESSLEEYSNASIISFDDKNVFPSHSVKVQNIRFYNNARVDRVFYYAASVFAYAGGPLQDVFEVATLEMGHSSNVRIFDTEAGFLATQVDGVNIFFGSAEALKNRGFEIEEKAEEDDADFEDVLSIMYMFRKDKLVAKMYVQYVMDADIDLILKQFSGTGLYVCVRTFDPNIDERMIAHKLNMKRMPLKIVRYASAEEVTAYEEKVDSGLVTCGSPKSLLQVISYCEKVLRTRKTNIALSVLSVLIGAAILALLLLSDSMGLLNSLYIAVYQLIWMIPLAISSKMFIR